MTNIIDFEDSHTSSKALIKRLYERIDEVEDIVMCVNWKNEETSSIGWSQMSHRDLAYLKEVLNDAVRDELFT